MAGIRGASGASPETRGPELKQVVENIQFGELVDNPLIPRENGSHEAALGIARTTAGDARVLAKRVQHHELVREVLCSLLAQAVDLPVPEPYVLDIRESIWSNDECSYAFATRYGRGHNLVRATRQAPATIASLERWPKIHALIAFDEWIANADRTAGNLLFIGPKDFQLIDHGEALPNWIDKHAKLSNRLARHLVARLPNGSRPEDLAECVVASCANFGTVDFRQIEVAAMLGAWRGDPGFGECIRLLKDRLNHLPALIEEEFSVGQGQLLA